MLFSNRLILSLVTKYFHKITSQNTWLLTENNDERHFDRFDLGLRNDTPRHPGPLVAPVKRHCRDDGRVARRLPR